MKKTLLLMWAFVMSIVAGFAQTATFDFTNPKGLTPSVDPNPEASKGIVINDSTFTSGDVSLTVTKGSSDAVLFTKADGKSYEMRVYGNATTQGTITITAPSPITKVEFVKGSKFGLSVTDGTLTSTTWTGAANTIVFTANSRSDIASITVTYGEGGTGEGGTGEGGGSEDEVKTLFSETFLSAAGLNGFTEETKTKPAGLTTIWSNSTTYGALANKSTPVKGEAEGWLISPEFDATAASELSLVFEHVINKGGDASKMTEQQKLYAKEVGAADWTEIPIATYPSGTNWTYVASEQSLAAYDGKKFQFAFVYTATADVAAVWEIKNLVINGKGSLTNPEPPVVVVPEYNSIADLKAAASASATAAKFNFTNLLVTAVVQKGTNYSVYVSDGTEAFLFYGTGTPNCKAGDKISGSLTGEIVDFYGTDELKAITSYETVTVASSDNEVVPVVKTVEELRSGVATYADQSILVKLVDVRFAANALTSRAVPMTQTDADEVNEFTMNLYDSFGVLASYTFNTEFPCDVVGIVAYRNGAPVIYPLSEDDITIKSTLKDPELSWMAKSEEVVYREGQTTFVMNKAKSKSDAAITYESSNTDAATIDATGNITVVGPGITTLTASVARTATYLEDVATATLYVRSEGTGVISNPYLTVDAISLNDGIAKDDYVWVKGTIMGIISNTSTGAYSKIEDLTEDKIVATNLAVGDGHDYLAVKLPAGDIRTALNLKDNPANQGKEVWLLGKMAKYCGVAGLKEVMDYSFNGKPVTSVGSVITSEGNAPAVIYTIDGVRQSKAVKGFNIINGKKVIVK